MSCGLKCDLESQFCLPALQVSQLHYSDKYYDDNYEYRHVILPKEFGKFVPKTHLMTETEWRNLGVLQSPGWVHYMIHSPEPHILMFRRPLQGVKENVPPPHGLNISSASSNEPIVRQESLMDDDSL